MKSELPITTEPNLPHYHVGEYLADDLEDLVMSARQFADAVGLTPTCVSEILRGKRRMSEIAAIKIARYLGTTPNIWLDLQTDYYVAQAEKELA